MWYNSIMKNKSDYHNQPFLEKQQQEMEDWIREIIREEIVNYNNVFMSRFGVDKDGVVHLTKGTKLN